MIEISIDGVIFYGGLKDSLKGLFVEDDGFRGWESGTGGRRDTVARPGSHGDYDLPIFRESRVVTIDGYALGRSAFDLGGLRDQVVGLGADGSPVDLVVRQHDDTRWARARVLSVDFVDSGRESSRASFSIELVCADPRKYGEQQSFSGSSVQVHHYGNFPAAPVIEVAGPRAAYTVSGPSGRSFQVLTALPSGQTDRIDLRTGRLTRNGSVAVGVVGRADVWAIPPGRRASMSISSGSMTVLLSDTYM